MGRWVDADELVSAAQVAVRVDTITANVLTWLKRYPDMPQPVARVGQHLQTPLWVWSELAPWLVEVGVLSPRHTVPMTGDPADELLSGKDVAELLGWADTGTAWKLSQHGTFPAPVRADRPRLWRRGDVEQWAQTHARRPRRRRQAGTVPSADQ